MNKYLKIRIVLFIIVINVSSVWGQLSYLNERAETYERIKIDESVFECVYEHELTDSDIDCCQAGKDILQIGKKYVTLCNYGVYQVDSVICKYNINDLTQEFYDDIQSRYPSIAIPYWLSLDKKSNNYTYAEIFPQSGKCMFTEPAVKINWEFSDETKDILGYNCKKASCSFRGREWTVWYSPDIKYSYGPWRLWGLPGLVLEAEDSRKEHKFMVVALRTTPGVMFEGEYVNNSNEVSREQFKKMEKNEKMNGMNDAWQTYYDDPINNHKPYFKHFPYVPFELE